MSVKFNVCENSCDYTLTGSVNELEIIEFANILSKKKLQKGQFITSSCDIKMHLQCLLSDLDYEIFGVVFLTNQNQIIESKQLFRGTINAASVYPREVVKEALFLGANSVIFYHNHPSGMTQPSAADKAITNKLVSALKLVDIDVLDHIVVGFEGCFSFSENGIL
ncbi:DNA repair protein RadC [Pseudoalteromonas agarivorans]|uniref:JAB domain-containing protein n=1 Tax=Pseudoalteromonas agarivorans TaxID=176102 RepID=UPI0021179B9E|nr:JAB domain-containing protein [Pseudoalteromonas agarivorans]MCQ8822243.1 DNA repair protein RadC [Pseudoalteromonas agarivorans]